MLQTFRAKMISTKDIKILLFVGYAVGFVLSVFAPIVIDPILKSHVLFAPRHYPYAPLCLPLYISLLATQLIIFKKWNSIRSLYLSVLVFVCFIAATLPIFLPEFPHGNIFSVGMVTAFLSSFSIFVWSISNRIMIEDEVIEAADSNTLEYIKTLFTFVRQAAFAGVALFGALFFASYTTGLKFVEAVSTDKSDVLLLNSNIYAQITVAAFYCVIGPLRYFFISSMKILDQFKDITTRLDQRSANKGGRRSKSKPTSRSPSESK
jgi:hypothetical protein